MSSKKVATTLRERLEGRSASVAVIGLGYVGLPLAAAAAQAGHSVIGVDLSQRRVQDINAGISTIQDVPSDVVRRLVSTGRLRATRDYSELKDVDVAVIAVPTPIDEYRVPDLSYVKGAVEALAPVMKKGSLVILESTSYPGTTEEIVVPALRAQGKVAGEDVFVGYSPERIDPGNKTWTLTNTPKIVSGLTPESLELTVAWYGSFIERLVPVSSLKTAEIAKVFENIFRIVNIALVNEFQMICDSFGIDVWEVIAACSTKPYGFMPFYPGPGLGGHCVPVDPFYLAWKAREKHVNTEFIELAGRINHQMPGYVVAKVAKLLNSNGKALQAARIALIGVAYKKDTSDVRESAAIRIIELLKREGADVTYHDPYVPSISVEGTELTSRSLSGSYLSTKDAIVIVTDHTTVDWSLIASHRSIVVDTRNVFGRLLAGDAARDQKMGAAVKLGSDV
ncbi:MAG TPA: nucleotide sugar dehydrogenase [Candidatus Limnocylindria bacterium]|jgi:nucleotide sugar dehydrogenase|nr:nucleotide sugar dehydrogenase [Candidatus Limnocylindria bacterium]